MSVERLAPNSAPQPVNLSKLLAEQDFPATEPVFIGDFTFSLRCVYCVAFEYHSLEHHDILRRAVPPTDWLDIYDRLEVECDRAFMAYHLAKSEHPEPAWSPVTNPLMKAWSESQAALFLLGGL